MHFSSDHRHAIFYHLPHGGPSTGITRAVRKDFRKRAAYILNQGARLGFSVPHGVTFVTYSNYKKKTLVEQCYDALAIPHVVVARDVEKWRWIDKIKPLLAFLDNAAHKTDHIVATDANDIIVANDPAMVVDYFNTYQCEILFCNTNANWPSNETFDRFESEIYAEEPFHAHLSAGGYIAKTDSLIEYLKEIDEGFSNSRAEFLHRGKFDDQASWRYLHYRDYPRIKVDHRRKVFCRYDNFRYYES